MRMEEEKKTAKKLVLRSYGLFTTDTKVTSLISDILTASCLLYSFPLKKQNKTKTLYFVLGYSRLTAL